MFQIEPDYLYRVHNVTEVVKWLGATVLLVKYMKRINN